MLEMFFTGFAAVLTFKVMALIFLGVVVGIIFGSIPGLTATMAVALCIPLTFGMDITAAISLLIGLYVGGVSGGLISAILINIPGTPSSVATCFDGSPLAKRGEAGKALGVGIVASFLGGLLSVFALIFLAPPLSTIALKFGPFEYFAIAVFSLTLIASLSGKSMPKGLLACLIGMMMAFVGIAPVDATPRFTFGIDQLSSGFDLLPVLIGLFAVTEVMKESEGCWIKGRVYDAAKHKIALGKIKGFGFTLVEALTQKLNFIRSFVIGLVIGILPGIGGGTSNLLAYAVAKSQSKTPEKFGTGVIDGIVASETSNNAAVGGAFLPLLTLGIPGDTVTAMLLGGFMIHGVTPGPLLLTSHGHLVYAIFAALIIAHFVMLIVEFWGLRIFVKALDIPKHILLPIIISLCVVGAYGLNNDMTDVWSLLLFGLLGFGLEKQGYPLAPLILGFILGPMVETNLRRGLMHTGGDFMPFLFQPIAALFFALTILSVTWILYKGHKKSSPSRA